VTVNVTPVNDAPEVDPSSGNLDPATGHYTHTAKEDTVINGKVVATDVDGDKLTYSAKDQPTHGSVVVNTDGSYVYTPNLDYIGKDQFTVTVSDGKGGTTTAIVDLNFTPGDAPIANPDAATTKEDTALVLTADKLLGNDSAGDNGPLKLTGVSNPSNGTVVLNADGTVTFTPAKDFNGDATFNYSAVDKNGNVVNSSVTVNVTPENDIPVPTDPKLPGESFNPITGNYAHTTPEDTAVKGKVVATDADGDKLTYTVSGQPTHGTVDFKADGTYTYTPSKDYNGKDSFSVLVDDGHGGKVTSIVNIDITPVNDAPTTSGGTISGAEDTYLVSGTGGFTWASFNIKDVDSADSALSIKITSLPADGKLQFFNGTGWENISSNNSFSKSDIDGGKLRFVPDANESGGNSFNTAGTGDQKSHYAAFNYEVSDGSQKSSAEMRVDIKPVADAPIISIGGISLVNDSTSTVTPPKGNGLTQQYYAPDANDNLNTTTARTPTRIETELEGKVPTSTTIVTSPDVYVPNGASAPSGIATDSAYRVSGLVYLEEGKTYTFSGYVDDTSLLKIGGVELMNRPYDGYGTFTATPFVPGKSGYYTVEMIVYNASNVGALDLNVSVNGGKAVDFNTSNFPLYSNLAQLENSGGLHSNLVATGDGGYYPQGISGQEDSFIKLFGLAAKLSDTDGSESLQSLSLTELKAGSTVFDGVRVDADRKLTHHS
ncbi:MAG: tandem-95 repeat protein, partial [Burkholderiales bacterium]|nr:tandem-95 repeat protein [Burkholderiales bacterium]